MTLKIENPNDTVTVPRELLKYIMNDVAMVNLSLRFPESKQLQLPDDLKVWALSQIVTEVEEVLYPA